MWGVRTPATGLELEDSCPSSTNILVILSWNFCSNLLDRRKTLDLGITHPAQVQTLIREAVARHPILCQIPLCKKYSEVQKYIIQWRNHFLKSHCSGEWLSQGSYFNSYSRRQWEVSETKIEGKSLVSLSILKVAMQQKSTKPQKERKCSSHRLECMLGRGWESGDTMIRAACKGSKGMESRFLLHSPLLTSCDQQSFKMHKRLE